MGNVAEQILTLFCKLEESVELFTKEFTFKIQSNIIASALLIQCVCKLLVPDYNGFWFV